MWVLYVVRGSPRLGEGCREPDVGAHSNLCLTLERYLWGTTLK